MAKKKEVDQNVIELKLAIEAQKVIVGKDRVLKALRGEGLKKVFISKNLPQETLEDLEHYCSLANVTIVPLNFDNEEFGVLAKKNFLVAMIGVLE
jgi:ribosomal protein L30E